MYVNTHMGFTINHNTVKPTKRLIQTKRNFEHCYGNVGRAHMLIDDNEE